MVAKRNRTISSSDATSDKGTDIGSDDSDQSSTKDKQDKKKLAQERNQKTAKLSRDKYKVEQELLKEYVVASVIQLNQIRNALAFHKKNKTSQKALMQRVQSVLAFNQGTFEQESCFEESKAPSMPIQEEFGTSDMLEELGPDQEFPECMQRVLTRVNMSQNKAAKKDFV